MKGRAPPDAASPRGERLCLPEAAGRAVRGIVTSIGALLLSPPQPPELPGGLVTERRAISTGENRSHPATLVAEADAADRVNARDEPDGSHPFIARFLTWVSLRAE